MPVGAALDGSRASRAKFMDASCGLFATLLDHHMREGCKEISWMVKDNSGRAFSSRIFFNNKC